MEGKLNVRLFYFMSFSNLVDISVVSMFSKNCRQKYRHEYMTSILQFSSYYTSWNLAVQQIFTFVYVLSKLSLEMQSRKTLCVVYQLFQAGDRRTNFKYAVFKIANLLGSTSVTHGKFAHTVLRCRRQKKPCTRLCLNQRNSYNI